MPSRPPDFWGVLWSLLGVAFVLIRLWVAANPKPRPRLARWSVAGAIVCFLAVAEMVGCHFLFGGCTGSPLPYWIGSAGALIAVFAAMWPDLRRGSQAASGLIAKTRRRKAKSAPVRSAQPDRGTSIPQTPVGEILRDLIAYHEPDGARRIVAEAALERHKPNSPSSTGTSAAPHVVRSRIRDAPGQARRQLELLEEKEFAALREMADRRSAEELEEALQRFTEVVRELIDAIEERRTKGGMRDRDWEGVATLYGRANNALTEVPLDKHREYAEDLAKIRSMVNSREDPSGGQHPFTLRDLRDRLDWDQKR